MKSCIWKITGWWLFIGLLWIYVTKVVIAEISTFTPNVRTEIPRKALVIGNGKYPRYCEKADSQCPQINLVWPLDNPHEDAIAIARRLQTYGFQVTRVIDADATELRTAISNFSADLKPYEVALVYYSGHGVTAKCDAYAEFSEELLVPVGIKIASEADLCVSPGVHPVSTQWILKLLNSRGKGSNILIFDACRNNIAALKKRTERRLGIRSNFSANLNPGIGNFISYSADSGQSANDSPRGKYSIYTRHLLELLKPGTDHLPLPLLFQRLHKPVAEAAWREIGKQQNPIQYNSMTGDLCFRESCHPPKQFAKLSINTVPKSAKIRFVDQTQAYTPGMLLPIGRYPIEVSASGYYPTNQSVKLQNDTIVTVYLQPKPTSNVDEEFHNPLIPSELPPSQKKSASSTPIISPLARLSIDTIPKSAKVRFVDKPWTYTPGMRLPVGHYSIKVSASGYYPVAKSINLQHDTIISINLQPQPTSYLGGARDGYGQHNRGSTPRTSVQRVRSYSYTQNLNPSEENNLAIRSGPGRDYPEIDRIYGNNTEVEVLEQSYPWFKVRHNGVTGWSYAHYLSEPQRYGGMAHNTSSEGVTHQVETKRYSDQGEVQQNTTCYNLWYNRNLIFAKKGYCFTTPLGQQKFSEYHEKCWINNPVLSIDEERRVNEIILQEQQLGCDINQQITLFR